jgi:5-methylcytosine-specific restriction endonuclease McrA
MLREKWVPADTIEYASYLSSLRKERAQGQASSRKDSRRSLSKSQRDTILRKTASRCHICGGEITGDWEADHVLAYSGGGIHSIDNYLPAHSVCNNYRWDYLSDEFQEILRLGVWLRTQIETATTMGNTAARLFIQNEKRRIKRRKVQKSQVPMELSTDY